MAANMGQTAPDDVWIAKLEEPILEPDLAIIDPHHHLWLRNGHTYLMGELAADLASGHNITATVFAECHSMYRQAGPEAERSLGETEFVAGQAAMSASGQFGATQACAAMFGNVDRPWAPRSNLCWRGTWRPQAAVFAASDIPPVGTLTTAFTTSPPPPTCWRRGRCGRQWRCWRP